VDFDLDNIIDIIGVLDDTKCTYLLDEISYIVKASTLDSSIHVGDNFLQDVDHNYIPDIINKLEVSCELTTQTCIVKRKNSKELSCKINTISFAGNNFIIVREK